MTTTDASPRGTGSPIASPEPSTSLLKGSIRFFTIVLMVTAAAAPLVVVSTYIPISYAYGSGFATSLTYLAATAILLLFAVGFAQMAKRITAAGAFYNFSTQGLGRPAGLGTGWTIMLAYSMIAPAISGGFGYFTSAMLLKYLSLDVPWWACSIAALALMFFISYFKVTVTGRVLGIALALEVLIVFLVATVVIVRGGAEGQMPEAFNPVGLLAAPAVGIGFFFAFWSWIGFETTAIYGEETTDPKKSVPRATYIAVITLGLFYAFAAYAGIVGFGSQTMAQAETLVGDYFFVLADMYTWPFARILMDFLVITGFFACSFAFHNNASRYIFSMGRDGILPGKFGRTHPVHRSPFVANGVQAAVAIVTVMIFAVLGADPLLHLGTWLPIFCTAAVVFVQMMVSIAVINYFNRVGRSGPLDYWKTLWAPALGAIAQGAVLVLLTIYIPFLAEENIVALNLIPLYVLLIFAAGIVYALYLRRRSPETYQRIGTIYEEEDDEAPAATTPTSSPTP
ncbi:APC family permease [Citricoccus nitrophenolicus]|uniref:APC family permease n=1 Tax=Citricoccus nitrophenolicus TaxID=863575 RepID=UPI0031EF77FC